MEEVMATNTTVKKKEEMTLRDLLMIIKSHIIVILCIIIGFFATGCVYTALEKPSYKASVTVLLQSNLDSSATTVNYSLSRYLAYTYMDILTDLNVCRYAAVDLLEEEEKREELIALGVVQDTEDAVDRLAKNIASNITIHQTDENSLALKIGFVSSSRKAAVLIANSYTLSAKEYIAAKLYEGDRFEENNWLNVNLSVFSEATEAGASKVTNTTRNMAIFLAAGVAVSFIYVVIREMLDTRFKSSSDVEKYLDVPVLATIPYYDMDAMKGEKK